MELLKHNSDQIWISLSVASLVVLASVIGCNKEDGPLPQTPPFKVVTQNISEITETSALCKGKIIADGGHPVLSKGICWSAAPSPLFSDHIILDTVTSNEITVSLTGLMVYTRYYFRVFAINSIDTIYGEELSFTTQGGTVTDMDGNLYHTISIGTQVWLLENLHTTRFRNGDTIPYVTDNAAWQQTSRAYCYYNHDPNQANTYGYLYPFFTVYDSLQLAPDGWHVPTAEEWRILSNNAGGGANLKEKGQSHWFSPNTGATNESGFTALPAGYRDPTGSFKDIREKTFFWSSTIFQDIWGNYGGWYRFLTRDDFALGEYQIAAGYGCSVRCIRD